MRSSSLLCALVLAAATIPVVACAPAPPTRPRGAAPTRARPAAAATPAELELVVEEEPVTDTWRVTYRLAAAARALRFQRDRTRFRAAAWRPVTPGVRWREVDGAELLEREDGAPLREVTLSLATDPAPKAKDYPLHVPFTGGGRLLYTGHLEVRPVVCAAATPVCDLADARPRDPAPGMAWAFRTAPGRGIRLLDAHARGVLRGVSPPADGTHVYFGDVAPLVTDGITLVIDPGAPRWLAALTRTLLPWLIDHHARTTGVALPFRPLVFVSVQPGEGRSFGGGVLSGLVQLAAWGDGWRTEDAEAVATWSRLLAHEAVHLWNGALARPAPELAEEWLGESTADALALDALVVRGILGRAAAERLVVEAANACLGERGGRALLVPPLSPRAFYSCGSVIQTVVDAAVRSRSRGERSLATVLGSVVAAALRRPDRTIRTADYLAEVHREAGPETAAWVEQALRSGLGPPADRALADALRGAGIPVARTRGADATLAPGAAVDLLAGLLARCDCARGWSVRRAPDHLAFGGTPGCERFARDVVITRVGAHRVADAAAAYAAVRARILAGRPVSLRTRQGDRLALRCRARAVDRSFEGLLRHAPPR